MNWFYCLFLALLLVPGTTQANDIGDSATLEAFVDGVMLATMDQEHVAGAVVVITNREKVLLAKGYGYADIEKGLPVTTDTLFRIGSVSKLFVWLPVMQLIEQGRLDLQTDVNEYLKSVQVENTFAEPITLKDLMTHTPGFEDQVVGLFGRDASTMLPLAEILNNEMPMRVRPPGQYASYSNHGVGIAGLIIEEITGQSWSDYVDEHVLRPLDMQATSTRQPLSEVLSRELSKGYDFELGKFVAKGFEFVPLGPAGGVSASGNDMGRFLRLFLNYGALDGVRVLGDQTSRAMQQSLFRPVENFNGMMHGMYETSRNGQTIIGHGGDTIWFHTDFMIMPDAGIGFYISTNTVTGPAVRAAFEKAFLDRFFPAPVPPGSDFEKTNLGKLAGNYTAIRHSHDDLTKIIALVSPISVAPTATGQLMLAGGLGLDAPLYFEEISPLVFKRPGHEITIAFGLGDDGFADHLYIDQLPVIAFEKMSGFGSLQLHMFILILSMLVFVWVLIAWTVQRRVRTDWITPVIARFRTTSWVLAATVLVFLIALSIHVSSPNDIVFGLSTGVKATLSMSYLIFGLSLLVLIFTPAVIAERGTGKLAKTGYLLVTFTAIAFSWFLYYWRLFTW